MDMVGRWGELMDCPEEDLPLDEAALVIAAHGQPGIGRGIPIATAGRCSC